MTQSIHVISQCILSQVTFLAVNWWWVCIFSAPLLAGDLLFVYCPFRTWRQIIAWRSSNPPWQPDATNQPNFNFAKLQTRQSHSEGGNERFVWLWFPRGCSSALNTPQYEIRDAVRIGDETKDTGGNIGEWIRR